MREATRLFSFAMEFKLQSKDEEKGTDGWLAEDCYVDTLFRSLKDEIVELEEAVKDCNAESIMNECVDVANFAMMIHDRIRVARERAKLDAEIASSE